MAPAPRTLLPREWAADAAQEHVQLERSCGNDGSLRPSIAVVGCEAPLRAGGFTERRYTPVDLLELMVLADLRRQGISVNRIRLLIDTLRQRFGIRLFEAIGGGGPLTLLTDGKDVYARTANGEFFNLLKDPAQPLLVVGDELPLKELTAKARGSRKRKRASRSGKPYRVRPQAAE